MNTIFKKTTPVYNIKEYCTTHDEAEAHLPRDVKEKYIYFKINVGIIAGRLYRDGHDVAIVKSIGKSFGVLVNKNDAVAIDIISKRK